MKVRVTLMVCVILISLDAAAQDTRFDELDNAIQNRDNYLNDKLARIDQLKEKLHFFQDGDDLHMQFQLCTEISYEYQSFVYDSAFHYIKIAKEKAHELKDPQLIAWAKTRQGFILLSSGLFKEAIDTLESISASNLPDSLKWEFYSVIARSYFDIADYNTDQVFYPRYIQSGNEYLDSALMYVTMNTNDYWSIESLRRMKSSDWRGARYAFEYWTQNHELPRRHYAIATSSLGYIYNVTNYKDKAIEYLTKAAVADIKTATKETVALRNLAQLLFENGDINRAYDYINLALEDATYFNARHRKIEIASILPIIEGERLAIVEKQKGALLNFSLSLILLSILVIAFLIIIYSQLKRIRKVKTILQDTNRNLNEINKKLTEANIIKEEYIGYFFNVNSEYIEKIDSFQKKLARKIENRQYEDLTTLLKNNELKNERDNLFRTFDTIFLKIFPNFIVEFNNLFSAGNQIELKRDELLNPELRIYALLRLGIKDNEKIAKFLNYSVNTIYTYKTKIKGKSLYRDIFEEKIMSIQSV